MLGNAYRNAHMGARPFVPGSAVRHHQLSSHSTQNRAAITYTSDKIKDNIFKDVVRANLPSIIYNFHVHHSGTNIEPVAPGLLMKLRMVVHNGAHDGPLWLSLGFRQHRRSGEVPSHARVRFSVQKMSCLVR